MASILRIVLARVPHCLLSGALVAQLVEHLICNQGVGGSSPFGGTIFQALSSEPKQPILQAACHFTLHRHLPR